MKYLKTFEEFTNESVNYNKIKLKTIRFSMKSIDDLEHKWRTGKKAYINNLLSKILDKINIIEREYNKEMSTYNRPGEINDMQYDKTMLSGYYKDIKNQLNIK